MAKNSQQKPANNTQPQQSATPPTLRLADIIGQEDSVVRLKKFGEFFVARGSTPAHLLIAGEDGMGKATLAAAFAGETGRTFRQENAVGLEIKGDLTAVFTNIQEKEVLLLDNVHLLRREIATLLAGAMREFKLDIILGMGPAARKHTFGFSEFTLIGTCPRRTDCPPELLREFALTLDLGPYSAAALQAVARSTSRELGVVLTDDAAEAIVACCEPRPGHVKSVLQRLVRAICRDTITGDDLQQAIAALGIGKPAYAPVHQSGKLAGLSGIEFEELIATLLTTMGFRAEKTKASGDGGIDIEATLDRPIVGGRYLFQCKRYAPDNLVGAPMLRDFYGAVTAERAVKGVFITTSDFTSQAREFGQKAGLELIDHSHLQQLLTQYGLVGDSRNPTC